MATLGELENALRKAHAAGNVDHARAFAAEIRKMREQPASSFDGVESGVSSTEGKQRLSVDDWQAERDQIVASNPLEGTGQYQRYLGGIGASLVTGARGLQQAGTSALENLTSDGTGLTGAQPMEALVTGQKPGSNRVSRYFQQALEGQQASEVERRRDEAPLREDPAFVFGDLVGTAGQLIGPAGALRGTSIGQALMPTSLRGNAGLGAAFGAIQPTANEGERVSNVALGGTLGTVGAAVPKSIGVMSRIVRGAPTPTGAERRAGETILAESNGLDGLMRPQPSAVPGVRRTLAEETLDPGIARLERQMRGQTNIFDPIDRSNNAARVAQLERISGTDGDLAAAVSARSTATQAARDSAMQSGPVSINRTVSSLDAAIEAQQGRPAVQNALEQVKTLLIKDPKTEKIEDRINVLDNVRKTIGDMLSGKYGGENAAALQGSRELIAVRDALNDEIGEQVPAFTAYLDAYRQASRPINRMDIGRTLSGSSSGGAVLDPQTGSQVLMPASFSKQARDLDAIAAKATGFRKAKAADILTPDDLNVIRSIQDDLQRQSFRATAGSGGNSMTQERQALQDRMGRRLASRLPVIGGFVDELERLGNQRVNERLAYLMANPDEARRVLAALDAKDRSVLNKALFQLSARTGTTGVPALSE